MSPYTLTMTVSASQTRLLLSCGSAEKLEAVLPPPGRVRCASAAPALLRGLSQWLDQPVRVVLSADASQISSCLGLTDEEGFGLNSVHYTVQAVERGGPRGRGQRIRGRIGDFSQLHLQRHQVASDGGAS